MKEVKVELVMSRRNKLFHFIKHSKTSVDQACATFVILYD